VGAGLGLVSADFGVGDGGVAVYRGRRPDVEPQNIDDRGCLVVVQWRKGLPRATMVFAVQEQALGNSATTAPGVLVLRVEGSDPLGTRLWASREWHHFLLGDVLLSPFPSLRAVTSFNTLLACNEVYSPFEDIAVCRAERVGTR
jgi:hypothetical protein